MTLSDISIRRPVLAIVASLLIITAGIASLMSIPVRELPDVDSAIVTVTTTYTGATPQIIDTDITEILESSIAGVSGVKTISSQSRRGRSQTVIEFETGRDIDQAANDVRDAVGRVRGNLPEGRTSRKLSRMTAMPTLLCGWPYPPPTIRQNKSPIMSTALSLIA